MINKSKIKKLIPSFLRRWLYKTYLYYLFVKDYLNFKKISSKNKRFAISWRDRLPQLFDKTLNTYFDRHYIYHPAWAVRTVKKINPKFHVDISSTLTFSSILSAFIPVKFYDYRPANLELDNLSSEKADLHSLPFKDSSVDSISCMHTVEHIGLGRYGDTIEPDGDLIAMSELKRVISPKGSLLFVVPIGRPRIVFNAHRVYSYDQIINAFSDLHLEEFSLILDDSQKSGMVHNATKELSDKQKYGCGCFWFKKK